MPLKLKSAKANPKPASKSSDGKKQDAKLLAERASRNPFQFGYDVAFLEHCARIYGEENFRLAFQTLRPLREKLSRYMVGSAGTVDQTEFDAYDEDWWTYEQLNSIIGDIQRAGGLISEETNSKTAIHNIAPIEKNLLPSAQKAHQAVATVKNSSLLQTDAEEASVFMPYPLKRKTDYVVPFSQNSLRIKQLNDGRVAVIGDKTREIIKSTILGGV